MNWIEHQILQSALLVVTIIFAAIGSLGCNYSKSRVWPLIPALLCIAILFYLISTEPPMPLP